jgi:hypothetical protein
MSDDKTLMPELLPLPRAAPGMEPRERVSERARHLLLRFRKLGVTAGAAVLSLQCSGGYEVVDSLPPPAQCAELLDPFLPILANATLTKYDDGSSVVSLNLVSDPSRIPGSYNLYVGYRIKTVRVVGGTVLGIDDFQASHGSLFTIRIAPAAQFEELHVEVDIGCGQAMQTKRYRVTRESPTGSSLRVREEQESSDGGADR